MKMTPIDPQGTLLGQDVSAYVAASWGLSAVLLIGLVGFALQQYLHYRKTEENNDKS